MGKTYSFKDTSGAITNPILPPFLFSGQIGLGQFVVVMATERTAHDTSADGTVMISYIPGDSGHLAIEVQQTSPLHAYLLDLYNAGKIAADAGNVSFWAATAITLRSLVDGSYHVLTGVSPARIPDKTYAAQGGKLTWILMAGDIQSAIV